MKRYFVYMVRCSDRSFYVGVTNNVDYRLGQHNFGYDPKSYTHSRRPVTLVHLSEYGDIVDAISWEKQLKGWSRAKKIALIKNDWRRIHLLSCGRTK